MKERLTIGMCTFDDYDGVYFSIQAMRLYHQEVSDELHFLVIDNNPKGPHGRDVKKLMGHVPNGTYIPFDEWHSTSVRDIVFKEAVTPYVLCMDSHVLLLPGTIKKLLDFYSENPDTKDLYQGPLIYDDNKNISTHFEPVWREQMWGVWATDDRGKYPDGEPFEIQMQGLGLFTCRKDAWPGFNPMFRGFGGEEGYIHEKFRKGGHKTYCLPFLRWMHRFDRPDGVTFPLTLENKIRNYLIGHLELELDPMPIIDHFSSWQERKVLEKMLEDIKSEMKTFRAGDGQELTPLPPEMVLDAPTISCIMPTYNRLPKDRHLVEESIESFLRQDFTNSELIILNDTPGQVLEFEHPRVRIINEDTRYPNLGEKFNALTDLCRGDFICPWADDDISMPWRLTYCFEQMHHERADYFVGDRFWFISGGGLSNKKGAFGHCMYTKKLHNTIGGYAQLSSGSDQDFEKRAKRAGFNVIRNDIAQEDCYYLYRWNTGASHLSVHGWGEQGWDKIGKHPIEKGTFTLEPHWNENYVMQIREKIKKDRAYPTRKISLTVKTKDPDNVIIPNADFILITPDWEEIEGTTGDDGTYTFENMPAGRYVMKLKSMDRLKEGCKREGNP